MMHNLFQRTMNNYYDHVGINLSRVTDEELFEYQDEAYEWFERKNNHR